MYVNVTGCLSQWSAGDLSRVYPASRTMSTGISFCSPWIIPLTLPPLDGWMDGASGLNCFHVKNWILILENREMEKKHEENMFEN